MAGHDLAKLHFLASLECENSLASLATTEETPTASDETTPHGAQALSVGTIRRGSLPRVADLRNRNALITETFAALASSDTLRYSARGAANRRSGIFWRQQHLEHPLVEVRENVRRSTGRLGRGFANNRRLDAQSLQPFAPKVLSAALGDDADCDIRGELFRKFADLVEQRRRGVSHVDHGQGTSSVNFPRVTFCLENGL